MLAYNKQYNEFCDDVDSGQIVPAIITALKRDFSDSEKKAFNNSLKNVRLALLRTPIPDDDQVGIEFKVPLTNRRIDFIIAGEDTDNKKNVVIVELKQWTKVQHTDMYDIVLLGKEQHVHPSWQAFSYSTTISNFNEYVETHPINIYSCAFLHDSEEFYYNKHANTYFNATVIAKVNALYERFLRYISKGAKILDLGCGSGRDVKAFLDMGYDVDAIDGSEKLARLASEYTGIQVKCMDFSQLNESSVYDAVWACASLLHVTSQNLPNIMARIRRALKSSGVVYASFKHGNFEGVRGERYYTDMTSERFAEVLNKTGGLSIVEEWYSDDVRADNNTVWYNVILRKV